MKKSVHKGVALAWTCFDPLATSTIEPSGAGLALGAPPEYPTATQGWISSIKSMMGAYPHLQAHLKRVCPGRWRAPKGC